MATSDQQFSCRTSDGRFGRATDASSDFIGPARITYIQVEGVANSNIKLYDGSDGTGALVFEGNCGTEGLDIYVPGSCLLYTSPSPRDLSTSRMPSSA